MADRVATVIQPHVAWEDAWLYPEIAERAGSHWATKLMTFEHQQIFELTRKLEAARILLVRHPGREATLDMQGDLFALEALLRAHIEREERLLIPLLETAVDEMRPGVGANISV